MSSVSLHLLLVISCCVAQLSHGRTIKSPKTDAGDGGPSRSSGKSEIRCDVSGCDYDLQLYCLNNGVIVMGSCSLKTTLCTDGQRNALQLADEWDSCFLATYTFHHPDQMVKVQTEQSNPNDHVQDSDVNTNKPQLAVNPKLSTQVGVHGKAPVVADKAPVKDGLEKVGPEVSVARDGDTGEMFDDNDDDFDLFALEQQLMRDDMNDDASKDDKA